MIGARQGAATAHGVMGPVLGRLSAWRRLSEDEVALVLDLAPHRRRVAAGDELVAGRPGFLLSGWAACQRSLGDGRRQILRLLTPGDVLGLPGQSGDPEVTLAALTDLTLVDAGDVAVAAREGRAAGLAAAFGAAERAHVRGLNDTILRLGAMSAYERTAHLLLELAGRLAVTGAGDGRRFPLPLTQEILSDTLGLSIVHTNRVLQQLRREQLLELRSGVAILARPDALAAVARGEPRSVAPAGARREAAEAAGGAAHA